MVKNVDVICRNSTAIFHIVLSSFDMILSIVSYSSSDLFAITSLIFKEHIFEVALLDFNPTEWEFDWLLPFGLLSPDAKLLICYYSVASKDKIPVSVSQYNAHPFFLYFLLFYSEIIRGSEFSSYEIELRNLVTQNNVTLRVTNSKMFIEILHLSY